MKKLLSIAGITIAMHACSTQSTTENSNTKLIFSDYYLTSEVYAIITVGNEFSSLEKTLPPGKKFCFGKLITDFNNLTEKLSLWVGDEDPKNEYSCKENSRVHKDMAINFSDYIEPNLIYAGEKVGKFDKYYDNSDRTFIDLDLCSDNYADVCDVVISDTEFSITLK